VLVCCEHRYAVYGLDERLKQYHSMPAAISASDRLPDLSGLIEPGVTTAALRTRSNPGSGMVSVLGHDEWVPLLADGVEHCLAGENIPQRGMDEGKEGSGFSSAQCCMALRVRSLSVCVEIGLAVSHYLQDSTLNTSASPLERA
jgi:hypothetical protein